MRTGKLELTWVDKDVETRLEPRVLVEDSTKSFGDPKSGNMLIFGDNLLSLKALEQDFAGKIKCIYIDPPYNTGSAFEHYDDGVEHSLWLSLMRTRLLQLRHLLSDDGSIWISIDDNEAHYLKVLCDEVFGRYNFVANVIWQKKYAVANDHKTIAPMHDHILVYRKSDAWQRNLLPRTEEKDRQYKFEDEKGRFRTSDYTCAKSVEERPNLYYPIIQPNSHEEILPSKTRVWAYSKEEHLRHVKEGFIYWGKDGLAKTPSFKRYIHLLRNQGVVPQSIWLHDYASHTDAARKEVRAVLGSVSLADDFITPKPEGLIRRVFEIGSNPGDWVLDSFAGSGTTGAVAHKMDRKWIMCEMGEHCHTHIIPRIKAVISGEQGGISESVGWKGGGGFKYFRLAESLLVRDAELSTKDHPVYTINPRYDAKMLIRAICKVEGFKYRNQGRLHGISSENRFLHVTTKLLTQESLDSLAEDISSGQSLLVYCTRSVRGLRLPENIEIKRIPRDLLAKCDFEEEK